MLIKSSFGLITPPTYGEPVACDAVSVVAPLNFVFIKTNLKLRHGIIPGLKEQLLGINL
jgi:hypothetical protein